MIVYECCLTCLGCGQRIYGAQGRLNVPAGSPEHTELRERTVRAAFDEYKAHECRAGGNLHYHDEVESEAGE